MSSKARDLIRSEVARWTCLKTPFGATEEETKAAAARRRDYALTLYEAVLPDSERNGFFRALGRALAYAATTPSGQQSPSADSMVAKIRESLGDKGDIPKPGEMPLCARCLREGGVQTFTTRLEPQMAVLLPQHKATDSQTGRIVHKGPKEPLCMWHVELEAWENRPESAEHYPMPRWAQEASR